MILVIIPGCTLKTKAKELDRYARQSAEALGIDAGRAARVAVLRRACIRMAKDEIATQALFRARAGSRRRNWAATWLRFAPPAITSSSA